MEYVWIPDRKYAEKVSRTTYIENVVEKPTDVIGKVDAVVVTTDIGSTHLTLAQPFIERNIPVFLDKPLTDNEVNLETFKVSKSILSSSSLRYARELETLNLVQIGKINFVSGIMAKSWERYGVHAVEGLYRILGSGVESVFNLGDDKLNLVLLEYASGQKALLQVIYDSRIFGRYDVFGEKGTVTAETRDTFYMFKKQLQVFVDFVKDRRYPYPPEETLEITKVIVAGIKSKKEKRRVALKEIC